MVLREIYQLFFHFSEHLRACLHSVHEEEKIINSNYNRITHTHAWTTYEQSDDDGEEVQGGQLLGITILSLHTVQPRKRTFLNWAKNYTNKLTSYQKLMILP